MPTNQKPIGFRTKNPNALTRAEQARRYRARRGDRCFFVDLDIASAAACLYLIKQWNFRSRQEAARVAMRYLAILTRLGLQRIDLDVFSDEDSEEVDEGPITLI